MKIIEAYYEIQDEINGSDILKKIEKAGRTCYKSEDRITDQSAINFVDKICRNHHESVIEHHSITVRFVCNRGVSHQIVRHRLGSYSQESTRYINYSKDKFGNEITVIKPCYLDYGTSGYLKWFDAMCNAEESYMDMINSGYKAEEARAVLPISVKTEIVVTYNLRQWKHFFRERTSKAAHPQIRELAIPLLKEFQEKIPVIFSDI